MKKYAVAYTNEFDNDLTIEIVEAENWKRALYNHSKMKSDDNEDWLPDDIDAAKESAFNAGIQFGVIEIIENK